jgi:hypothetical protein
MKVKAILNVGPPQALGDAHKLIGYLASLSRFISILGEKGLSLYKLSCKMPDWRWTLEAQKDFNDIKEFLTKPPILVAPHEEEPLLLYVTATTQVVSVAIVVKRKEEGHIKTIRWLIYFHSQILAKSKTRKPTHPKDTLWGVLGKEEAGSPLQCAPNYRGHLLSARRDHQQSGCDRMDSQMGPRTYGGWYHVCATHVHKILGSSIFCCRMDRSTH